MKKQIHPSIKAHLLRSVFYLLLLVAVCAIPFALAQSGSRGTTKRTVTNRSAGQPMPISPTAALSALASTGNRPVQIQKNPLQRLGVGSVLWYNGDFNTLDGLANEDNTSLGSGAFASVYDDFNVTDPGGWDVTAVFSDNLRARTSPA